MSGPWETLGTLFTSRATPVIHGAYGHFSGNRPSAGAVITIPTAAPVVLTIRGQFVAAAQGASAATFYDVDSGVYYAHAAEGSGTWRVEVAGATVIVTPLSAPSSATHAYASVQV